MGAPEDWRPPNPPAAPDAVFAHDDGFEWIRHTYALAAAGHPQARPELPRERAALTQRRLDLPNGTLEDGSGRLEPGGKCPGTSQMEEESKMTARTTRGGRERLRGRSLTTVFIGLLAAGSVLTISFSAGAGTNSFGL